ncbi:MAG: DUF1934 domain-containing protein [Clostridiales bacterium]|nr:DUF1934 domain-containing protein [Clostridiales bacterium]HBM79705.1 DUF1934 domain-containing protein [Clostridiaceae bacterium]
MNKKVIVNVKSKQVIDGEDEKIELITTGKFYKKESSYFVVYDETEISGMEGTTTTVKIDDDQVDLIRFGTISAKLGFKKGKKDISLYKTPFGITELVINPSLVDINVGDEGGEVKLLYELEMCGYNASSNELYIKIQKSN